jgi:diguanylate cyclase (GGDEF)-like protein
VFLPEASQEEAEVVAEALARSVRAYQVEGTDVGVTVSMGIATVGAGFDDVETLLHAADGAMYEAKRAGGDRWVIAAPADPPFDAVAGGPERRDGPDPMPDR